MRRATAHIQGHNSGLPTSRTLVQAPGVSHLTAIPRRCDILRLWPVRARAPDDRSCSPCSAGAPLHVAAPHLKRDLECCASLNACHAGHSNQAGQNDCLV